VACVWQQERLDWNVKLLEFVSAYLTGVALISNYDAGSPVKMFLVITYLINLQFKLFHIRERPEPYTGSQTENGSKEQPDKKHVDTVR